MSNIPLDKQYHFSSLEICAGAGGQALGLEKAGFNHTLLIEYEHDYCQCIKSNRPQWDVLCQDVRLFSGFPYRNKIDLLSGGVPCPPFSVAGKQLGKEDERDLFPEMLRLVNEISPKVVMIENVKGFLDNKFTNYRSWILSSLNLLGYSTHIKLINASDYGVSQLRPRVIIVGVRNDLIDYFTFPEPFPQSPISIGNLISDLMSENGWKHVEEWVKLANNIAPTIVGGSKKHGGPDLGPSRARTEWLKMGIDGRGIADTAPDTDFEGFPKLTPRMLARIQGFPDSWNFGKKKTLACRMIGNAFPPPVAEAIGKNIFNLLFRNEIDNSNISKRIS